jgi:hypothetical protein
MAKFKLKKGDKIIARRAALREEGTGKILFIPDANEKPLIITKVWYHGVRCQGFGYVHNNCILSKIEDTPYQEPF